MLSVVNIAFYGFCGFRSVAFNSVYKLQFFTFIFAVLLPVLSSLLIMSINTTFSIFQDGGRPPSKIFKSSKYQLLVWRAIHYCVRTYENFLLYDSSDRAYIYARIYDFFRTYR